MPLFDPNNPSSFEVQGAYSLRTIIAACDAFQELCGVSTDADAEDHITVGVYDNPVDDTAEFKRSELARKGAICRIVRQNGSRQDKVDGYGQVSSAGAYEILFRRPVGLNDNRPDVDSFVWDRLAAIQYEMVTALATATCPRIQGSIVTCTEGPFRCDEGEANAQGEFHWATFLVPWGEAIGD